MKKGTSMFSDIFMLFVLIVMMLVISGMLWAIVATYSLGQRADRDIKVWVFEAPVKNDGILLSYLETTHDGIPMKDLLVLAILQNSQDGIVEYDSQTYDLKSISKTTLDQVFVEYYTTKGTVSKKYLLHLTDPDIILSENGVIKTDDKVSVKILGIDKSSTLELYVG